MHESSRKILEYFKYEHRPEKLAVTSKLFSDLSTSRSSALRRNQMQNEVGRLIAALG